MSSTTQTTLPVEQSEPTITTVPDEQCTCPWPADVSRIDTSTGSARPRVVEVCNDCGGRVN